MSWIDLCGILGGMVLAYSNIPQIIKLIRQKHAHGISTLTQYICIFGLILKAIYTMHTTGYNLVLLIPYLLAILCAVVTLYYCYFPKKE